MTADFIQIELFAIFIAVGIGICIWGIWKIIETLAEEYDKEQKKMINELFERELQNTLINDVSLADYIKENYVPMSVIKDVLEKIRAEIERLHYHPKLDFIKNDEVVEMALDIIGKYTKGDTDV